MIGNWETSKETIDKLARECIEGKYGKTRAIRANIESMGVNYDLVKERIKEIREEEKKSNENKPAKVKKTRHTNPIKRKITKVDNTSSVKSTDDVKETEEETKEQPLSPAEYFELIKGKVHDETPENVKMLYNTCMKQLKKYMVTGQKAVAKELYAKCLYLEKEIDIINKGITKYVNRTDINEYIDKIADKCVVLIEMQNYEREIPEELIDIVADTKDVFDEFFVLFTDYNGEKRSKVEKERREKDPILFGSILIDGRVGPKLFYIGDWVDEYCDLTLDKLIEEMTKTGKKEKEEIVYDISDFSTLDEIEKELLGTNKRISKRKESDMNDK